MQADPARAEAYERLVRIEEDRAYAGLVSPDETLDPRALRQASEYAAGVTRWKRWLDFVIDKYYLGNQQTLDPRLRQILRIGVYDLLMLNTPAYAAVNEAVQLSRAKDQIAAAGLVNGLLRTIDRQRDRLPQPPPTPRTRSLGIRHSHPDWLVRRWRKQFGEAETEALMAYNNARPVFGLRINTQKVSADDFKARLAENNVAFEPSPWLPDFVRVSQLQPILDAGLLQEGYCAVQDESAGLIVRVLDPQPGETIADVCSAPGGKALYAATLMQNEGQVFASDLHGNRLNLLQDAAKTHGLSIIHTKTADARELPGTLTADRVLLDAPCSGLGVLAKRADLRWNRQPEDLTELVDLQDELLEAAARVVRPGGLLVYSTCTIAPEENEERIQTFLQRHPEYRIEPADIPAAFRTASGALATLPHRDQMDGAYAVRLRHQPE